MINVSVNSVDERVITNYAEVSSDQIDLFNGNDYVSEDTTIGRSAELSVVKTADVDTAIAGGNITYTIQVTNHGPSTAQNVVVIDNLPSEVDFVSANPAPNQIINQTLKFNILSLGVEESFSILVNVTVKEGVLGSIFNQVVFRSL